MNERSPAAADHPPVTAIERWLRAAQGDADRRGLPELKPLLQGLAATTSALRAADWNDSADQTSEGAARAPGSRA